MEPGMAHVAVELADAIVARLAAGSPYGGAAVTVSRDYTPVKKREEIDGTEVIVVPKSMASATDSRTSDEDTLVTDVAILAAVDPADTAALDALMTLADAIFERLRRTDYALSGASPARWVEQAHEPLWVQSHLVEQRVFLSVIKLTHVIEREA